MTIVAVEDTYVQDMIKRKLVHEVHTSERRSFRGCRRRWNWVFREGYYPPITAKPLEFGIAFHRAMEVLHNPATWKYKHLVLGALAEKAFVDECRKQQQEYLRVKDKFCLEGEEEDDYNERVELGRGMLWYYVKTHLPKLQQMYVPVYVEASFDVPLTGEDGQPLLCRCRSCRRDFARAGGGKWWGNPVVFSGRLDLIVHDMAGGYWIFDWKTAAQLRDIDEYLELDDQVAGYCMALRKKLGLDIRGFIYFEVRKDYPQPPKENKVRRLGRIYSVNQQQATDYATYLATVQEHDKDAYEAGLYDEHLEWLQTSGTIFYAEHKVYKTDYQLYTTEQELVLEALDMTDPNLRIYKTPGRFSCNGCAFKIPCMSKDAGQDYQYTLDTMYEKRDPYYRIQNQKASTESRGAE